jgi:membrane protease YdiL (CAAX protease family)
MKNAISKHPLLSFFAMAFLFSWIAVMPLLLNHALPVEPFQILGALAGPTLAAVIVIAVTAGKAGLGTFFKRYVQWRAGIIWWLIVLFGPLLALTLVAALIVGPSVLTEFLKNIGLILPTYLLTLIVGVILGPLWEEPGWRGFALPRLQAQFGPLVGTLILGVLWALWHIPGYLGGWMGARTFWICPRCGRQFVSANKWHSCEQFQIEDHFNGKDPLVRELYDLLLATLNEFGPVTAYALKTRIVFQAQTQFAAAIPRKRWLEGYLWLRRRAFHPLIRRVEMQMFRDYGHIFRLTQPADLDDDLAALLHEGYMLGCQPLTGR